MATAPCPYCGSLEGSKHDCPGPAALLLGKTLDGRYEIEDILGQGGMGMVYRATQTSVKRPVAVTPSIAAIRSSSARRSGLAGPPKASGVKAA